MRVYLLELLKYGSKMPLTKGCNKYFSFRWIETTGPGPAACYVHPKVSGAPSHSMAGRPRHRQGDGCSVVWCVSGLWGGEKEARGGGGGGGGAGG